MKKIKLGFVGGGKDSLIGILHKVASQMYDKYDLVSGVFSTDNKTNIDTAKTLGLDLSRVYESYEDMIKAELKLDSGERIKEVSILTPNFLHYTIAKKFLENGFNIICEKPLTITLKEALELKKIKDCSLVVFIICAL